MGGETVCVVGTGQTRFKSHHADLTYPELAGAAVRAALDDSGLTIDDIDAVVYSMAPTEFMGVNDAEKWAVDDIGAAGKPFLRVHTGGATGGSAFLAGADHVASGVFGTVLVVGADRVAETPDAQHVLNLIWDRFYESDFALNTVTMTALAAQRYMHKYGTTEEQFARVVVRARRNAMRNPHAHLKGEISVDDVMASPRIAWPFKRFDICPRSSGACAVILTTLAVARRVCPRPAFVTGRGGIAHTVFMGDRLGPDADTDLGDHDGCDILGRECFRQAGITDPMRQIDVTELYDPFSSFQFMQLEALGFCPRGRAADLDADDTFAVGGAVAVNPSGGTLCTNPIGVTGLVRAADAARQVMGRAGESQIAGARTAVATAVGGSTQFFTCAVLADDHT